ncbi:MAG: hypothetical protein HUU20_24695 [Pirellulales bacterium]|nr:hypothetical protein [Pirellulales bacterium]
MQYVHPHNRLLLRIGLAAGVSLAIACPIGANQPPADPCSATVVGNRVVLESPAFRFTLDATDGLRAVSWENRLTGRTLNLGGGPEVELDIGLPGQPLTTPKLRMVKIPAASAGICGEAVFELAADAPKRSATVAYRWDAKQPVLRKFVTIANHGSHEWNRLLNVRLGSYATDAQAEAADPDYPALLETRIDDLAGTKRGFPAYVEGQFFVGLAHPAGFAIRQDREITLRQLPGIRLAPGTSFECMEAVYGVSRESQARPTFRDHIQCRMRRVLRGHDRPLAIFEPFGAKPDGSFWETEDFVLDNIARLSEGQQASGLHWDYYSIDFWTDPKGDLKTPDAGRFPNGFTGILTELRKLGTLPGLWVDSGNLGEWTIVANPAITRAWTKPGGSNRQGICRATEPANRFYIEGYRHQLRENGVRLVKFDNALLACDNPAHDHLPGEYSVEPIENSLIDFCRSLDLESPDVFIMLYWHYQSPWWLQYADTVYDIGMHMEGASFSPYPALRARDSVTRRLDSGRWMLKDWPALGWDTLGVWLSDWPWNSRVGKEAWQGGVIMDISRGHLLAQLWSDTPYLSPDERRQMADFLALLKTHPDCFRNPRFILGNPWKEEPYGYCCTDGNRAFLAINNGVWHDSRLTLELSSAWGLPDGRRWDLYRWWPDPARLGDSHGSKAAIGLRPFDIVLLEALPAGERPALDRPFDRRAIPADFAEPSREVPISVAKPDEPEQRDPVRWTPLDLTEFRSIRGAKLTKQPDGSLLAGGENPPQDSYLITSTAPVSGITAIRLEALPDDRLPNRGPGRAVNGNFTLAEFTVSTAGRPVPIAQARADFSQTSHGGWPAEAAIDGKPQTGWAIDPAEGMRHVVVFELAEPLVCAQGTVLEFRLDHTDRQHSIGRLRLSATSAKPPISVPRSETRFLVRGAVPPTETGGVLAVSDRFFVQPSAPHWTNQCRSGFSVSGTIAGTPAEFEPVVDNAGTYAAPWQTWRLPVAPSESPQPFELRLTSTLPSNVEHRFSAHFLPR